VVGALVIAFEKGIPKTGRGVGQNPSKYALGKKDSHFQTCSMKIQRREEGEGGANEQRHMEIGIWGGGALLF